jgi:hypothetical protein
MLSFVSGALAVAVGKCAPSEAARLIYVAERVGLLF